MPEVDSNPQASPQHEQVLTNADGDRDEEVILGVVDDPFTEDERYARVPYNKLRHGSLIAGDCGQGKSGLLTNLLVQLAEDGRGFCWVDTNHNALELLRRLPDSRLDDVVLVGDLRVIGEEDIRPFDLLEIPASREQVSHRVVTATLKSGGDYWGPKMDQTAELAGTIAAMNGKSVLDLPDVADIEKADLPGDDPFAEALVDSPLDKEDSLPLLKRIHELRENPVCRALFDPDGVSIQDAVTEEKIVIGAFSGFDPTPLTVAATGLITKFIDATRHSVEERSDNIYPLVVDQLDIANLPVGIISSLASEGRSYNSPLIASLQYIGQLDKDDRKALLNNTPTLLAFRTSGEQAANLLFKPLGLDGRKELLLLDRFVAQSRIEAVDGVYQDKIETMPMIAPRRSEEAVVDQFNG
jgi:hypothetical protein